jgi:hypothetical protein
MEGPRGHRGTYREPAIVNLAAGGREFVQRLPVRIRFNPNHDPHHLLRPGMSVEPQVNVR